MWASSGKVASSRMSFDYMSIRFIWNNQEPVTKGLGFRDIYINPSADYPFGRKGLALMTAWECMGEPNNEMGMLILDGDVAIDPLDNHGMLQHIWSDPFSVWVAPARIWPISHLGDSWTWGHGRDKKFTQEDIDDPDMFSFCFTYLPRELIELMKQAGADDWEYPNVDHSTWLLASANGIRVKVARECSPKHMHY